MSLYEDNRTARTDGPGKVTRQGDRRRGESLAVSFFRGDRRPKCPLRAIAVMLRVVGGISFQCVYLVHHFYPSQVSAHASLLLDSRLRENDGNRRATRSIPVHIKWDNPSPHQSPSALPRLRHSSESIQIQNSLATELKIRNCIKRGSLTGSYLPGILDDGLPQLFRL